MLVYMVEELVKTDCLLILINSIRLTLTASLGSQYYHVSNNILIFIVNMIIMFITESAAVHNYVCSSLQVA